MKFKRDYCKTPFSRGCCKSAGKQSGQALLEYVLVLTIAASVSVGFMTFFSSGIGKGMLTFNAKLEQQLEEGAPTPDVGWEN